jgi:hypothetical protein
MDLLVHQEINPGTGWKPFTSDFHWYEAAPEYMVTLQTGALGTAVPHNA